MDVCSLYTEIKLVLSLSQSNRSQGIHGASCHVPCQDCTYRTLPHSSVPPELSEVKLLFMYKMSSYMNVDSSTVAFLWPCMGEEGDSAM